MNKAASFISQADTIHGIQECAYVYFLSKINSKVVKTLSDSDRKLYMERKMRKLVELTNCEYKPALEVALQRVLLRNETSNWEYGTYTANPMQKAQNLGIERKIKYVSIELDGSNVVAAVINGMPMFTTIKNGMSNTWYCQPIN